MTVPVTAADREGEFDWITAAALTECVRSPLPRTGKNRDPHVAASALPGKFVATQSHKLLLSSASEK